MPWPRSRRLASPRSTRRIASRPRLPQVNPFISVGIGAAFCWPTGVAGDVVGVFVIIGASFGPCRDDGRACFLAAAWTGPRTGFNPGRLIAWLPGFESAFATLRDRDLRRRSVIVGAVVFLLTSAAVLSQACRRSGDNRRPGRVDICAGGPAPDRPSGFNPSIRHPTRRADPFTHDSVPSSRSRSTSPPSTKRSRPRRSPCRPAWTGSRPARRSARRGAACRGGAARASRITRSSPT